MITPAFDLSQEPEFLILSIRVPYTRTSEFDLYIDGTDLKFFAKPYFLRLSLPGRIVEDGREKAKFDIDAGLVTLRVPKETAGEHFEGLQMLTSLLAPKGARSAKPLIEDLSPGGAEDDDEEDFDWQMEQEVYKETSEEELGALQKYGFGNQRCGVFARLQEELSDVIDLKNPEGATADERRRGRLDAEASAFSPDHYLADLFEDAEIKELLKFRPWWEKLTEQEGQAAVSFTDDEKEQLRKFTNRSYLLDKASRHQAWLGLVDILLAYCYEARSTEGEHNVESPWTIRKLSGTLCWLETYSSLHDVLLSFGRRVLCYPLYRHFAMASAAVRDATKILQTGKACVLRGLLDIHRVFRENDPAYILNDLYITDYCVWIQRVKNHNCQVVKALKAITEALRQAGHGGPPSPPLGRTKMQMSPRYRGSKKMSALAETLQKASLQKKDLGLELDELEEAAAMVAEEDEDDDDDDEEDGVASDCALISGSDSSSSSSDSSDESEESEGQSCTESNEGGGGGAEGGGASKDNPPQPQPISAASPVPRAPTGPLLPASQVSSLLIQELGERVEEELRISPGADRPSGSGSIGGTLLEPSPRRNPLLIVTTPQEGEDGAVGP